MHDTPNAEAITNGVSATIGLAAALGHDDVSVSIRTDSSNNTTITQMAHRDRPIVGLHVHTDDVWVSQLTNTVAIHLGADAVHLDHRSARLLADKLADLFADDIVAAA